MKQETFNAAYYSAAAQVIPVLIFAAAASKWWRKRPDDPWHVNTMLVGVVLIALAGEAFAMKALQFERDASAFEDNVIGMAFGLPVVYVFLALAEDQVKVMLQQAPPGLRRWGWYFLGPFIVVVIVGTMSFGLDPTLFFAIAGLALFIGPLWVEITEGWLERKRAPQPKSERGNSGGPPPP